MLAKLHAVRESSAAHANVREYACWHADAHKPIGERNVETKATPDSRAAMPPDEEVKVVVVEDAPPVEQESTDSSPQLEEASDDGLEAVGEKIPEDKLDTESE